MVYIVCWVITVGQVWSCDPPISNRIAALQSFRADVERGMLASISMARNEDEAFEQATRYQTQVAE
jgi:hypothetical protein